MKQRQEHIRKDEGGNETCPPEKVHEKMEALLKGYNAKTLLFQDQVLSPSIDGQMTISMEFSPANHRAARKIVNC